MSRRCFTRCHTILYGLRASLWCNGCDDLGALEMKVELRKREGLLARVPRRATEWEPSCH